MAALDMFEDTFVEDQRFARRLHPVRRFFARLLVVLVLGACTGTIFVWRYQPLTNGSTYGVRGETASETTSVGGSNVVMYSAGESFEMIFTVRNSGAVTVRVTGVPDTEIGPIVASYDVSMMPRNATAYDDSVAASFQAFVLRPGEERLLVLRYTFKDCGESATAGNRTVRRQPVRYELPRQFSRVAEVALSQPLVIMGMPTC